jgi:hypothetical protein
VSAAASNRRVTRATALVALMLACAGSADASTVPQASPAAHQKSTKPPAKRASQQTAQVPASLLRAVRASVDETLPVKIVRSPKSGVVRIALDMPLVKETDYRAALVAGCGEIVRTKAGASVNAIEVVNADQRQGYVYRPASRCNDLLGVDEERRRLAIVPATTIFRAADK